MIPTLYITRDDIREPFGQGQVLTCLLRPSRDYRITLITYEEDGNWVDAVRMDAMRAAFDRLGIRWLPRPKLIVAVLSMLRMVSLLRREVQAQSAPFDIPAAVALAVSRLIGVYELFGEGEC